MLGIVLLVEGLRRWPVASQQRARRNAMIAATACAKRRAERQDVARFLARPAVPAAAPAGPVPASLPLRG